MESPFRPRRQRPFVQRAVPVSRELPGYPEHSLQRDLIAGFTVAALAIPGGMAYAQLAGLSPVAGLYALLLPAVAYAAFGSSRHLSVGPEGAITLLVAISIAPLATNDPRRYATLAAMLAVVTGGIFLVARLIRLGWVADYFSRPVLVGYVHGIAVVLVIGQVGKLLGQSISAREPLPQVREVAQELSDARGLTIAIGFLSLAVLLLLRWKARRVPGALIVVVASIVLSYIFDLASHGVAVVGPVPRGLPSLEWPGVNMHDFLHLLAPAAGLFFVGYAEAVLTGRSYAGRHNQHIDANQELLAMGAANAAAGLTQSFAVGASGSRTAANDDAGGRTQAVGLIAALVALVVVLFLTDPIAKLPIAVLGAVIIGAAISLIAPDDWRALAKVNRGEVLIAAVTMAGVIVIGVLKALLIAVGLSIVDVVRRSAKPHDAVLGYSEKMDRYTDVTMHHRARQTPGVVVYRLDDHLIYNNCTYVCARVQEAIAGARTETHWLIFDAEGVPSIDGSGIAALEGLINELERADITFVMARVHSPVSEALRSTGLMDRIGEEHIYPTVHAAVGAYSGN